MNKPAKLVTWLGEDDEHYTITQNENGEMERNSAPGPSFIVWNNVVRFDKGKPVLIDPSKVGGETNLLYNIILDKTPNMQMFKVEDVPEGGTDIQEPKIAPPPRASHPQPVRRR